jgi:uncharacterized protein (TIGR02466 family)
MKIESNILGLFPTPIYISNINRNFTKEENKFFLENKKEAFKNEGNMTSLNTYVLNNKNLKVLKEQLNLFILDYLKKVVNVKNDISPFITQSWLNFTEKSEFHHSHEHPNSYISGVLYINAKEEFDKIVFWKKRYEQIKLAVNEFNIYNSDSWWVTVKTGDIVLFPSSTTHSVFVKEGDNTRTSLAFNVFFKGKWGEEKQLTEVQV